MINDKLTPIIKKYYDFPAIRKASFLPPFIDNRKRDENNDSHLNS